MKKIFSIIAVVACVIFSSFTANAQEQTEITFVVVNLKDGSNESFRLLDEPAVRVENHKLKVSAPSMECEYDFDNVSHFSFEKRIVSEVDKVTDSAFSFTFVDNAHVVVSATDLQWVAAYNLQGLEVARIAAVGNTATVDLSDAPAGVYVIATSCHPAIKIVKR